jgi:hypothetical protein
MFILKLRKTIHPRETAGTAVFQLQPVFFPIHALLEFKVSVSVRLPLLSFKKFQVSVRISNKVIRGSMVTRASQ